jgi:hypothetical protein
MALMILSFLSVTLFCFSARGLIVALSEQRHLAFHPEYSRLAIRMERTYKVFAWACLTAFLFASMVSSFWQSFRDFM